MVTIKVDIETLNKIRNDFKENIIGENIGYIIFVAKTTDYVVTAYDNKKKNTFKITIQGEDPLSLALKYSDEPLSFPKKKEIVKESPYFIDVNPQIGSDEVGTGDFLGPVVVCAAFCDNETMKFINEYGITDSKKLSDKQILTIVPLLIKKVYYEAKVLSIEKYNNAKAKGFNLNQMKAILHNFCLLKLHARVPYVNNVYMDKFVDEDKYYEYLKGMSKIQKGIIFKEKGETYFPSVALASCIARYLFLQEIDLINKKYNVSVPLGAGEKVNLFSKSFIHKFGIDEFNKIAKKSFANYKEVTDDSTFIV